MYFKENKKTEYSKEYIPIAVKSTYMELKNDF